MSALDRETLKGGLFADSFILPFGAIGSQSFCDKAGLARVGHEMLMI